MNPVTPIEIPDTGEKYHTEFDTDSMSTHEVGAILGYQDDFACYIGPGHCGVCPGCRNAGALIEQETP